MWLIAAVGKTAGFYGFRGSGKIPMRLRLRVIGYPKFDDTSIFIFIIYSAVVVEKGLESVIFFLKQKLGLPAALHGSYHEISTDLLVVLGGMKRVTGSFQVVFPSRRRSCTFGSKSSSILQPRHVMNMIFSSKTKYNTQFIRLVSR